MRPGFRWALIGVVAILVLTGGVVAAMSLLGSDDSDRQASGLPKKADTPLDTVLESSDESEVLEAANEVAEQMDVEAVRQITAAAATRSLVARALTTIRDRLIGIYEQSSADPQRRSAVLNALAPIDDEASVRLVFRAVTQDPDPDVQSAAASALGTMSKSVAFITGPLIDALKGRPGEAYGVEEAIIKIGRPAMDPLIALARKKQEGLAMTEIDRISTAGYMLIRMINENAPAIDPLLQALDSRDLRLVADLAQFYISLGKPGSEGVLVEALNKFGDDVMVLMFYGSGNDILKKGAEDWARRHGRRISGESGESTWGKH